MLGSFLLYMQLYMLLSYNLIPYLFSTKLKKIDFNVDVTEVSDSDKEFEYTFDILIIMEKYI